MSTYCRELESGICEITQEYKGSAHNGIDIVNKGYTLGYIVAHTDGTVVGYRNDCNWFETGSYGNYVKIKHDNGYYTLYAHMAYNTVTVKNGDRVTKGQRLGYMGNTGYSFGGHLHFEVRNTADTRIDPTPYLNADLPGGTPTPTPTPSGDYKVGDVVEVNGIYVSSTSEEKLNPGYTVGTITRIISGARNPYLIDDGNLGWTNDSCIVKQSASEPEPTPTPTPVVEELKVGDTVKIIGTGNGSSYGTSNTAYGIGWTRTILKIWDGRAYPYQVGNNTGTTGFYTKSALEKK